MSVTPLLKGFEVELFTGRASGENVGVSSEVIRDLPGFVTEPDRRNLEYITAPLAAYDDLEDALLKPRRELRHWLADRDLTLLPGSALSLGNPECFERSNPDNPYHQFIEDTYGTSVVTASVHINLGLEDLELLFAAVRLVRCEAALLLALSASSPFLAGKTTGRHSQRWHQFPLTPQEVPLFLDHQHYINWVEEQLKSGAMRNERHLWTSVRPNGPDRPYKLNRLELRICDLVTDPAELIAITALLELRVQQLMLHPEQLDPLRSSALSMRELQRLADANDQNAAANSLNATLHHWSDGSSIACRDWIRELIQSVEGLATAQGIKGRLSPLEGLLQRGNQAMRWLTSHDEGQTISALLRAGTLAMEDEEVGALNESAALG